MLQIHFDDNPYEQSSWNLEEKDIEGTKFKGWKEDASYRIETTVVLQINTTHVSAEEYKIAPNLSFLSTNQALINIYKTWHRNNVSFNEFRSYYMLREASLDNYVQDLANRLNAARDQHGFNERWFINYSLNSRNVKVYKNDV